jgi:secondary thiamine-phosphate synthase enzyme
LICVVEQISAKRLTKREIAELPNDSPTLACGEMTSAHVSTESLVIRTTGKGTYEITDRVSEILTRSSIAEGTLTVFVQHTSCSLIIMENADPTARRDLEEFFDRLVPENAPYFEHNDEGPDDMPSHIRSVLTRSSEVIPVAESRMQLGTWQGIFLFEHRQAAHSRKIVVTVMGRTAK